VASEKRKIRADFSKEQRRGVAGDNMGVDKKARCFPLLGDNN